MPTPESYRTPRNQIRTIPARVWVGMAQPDTRFLLQVFRAHSRSLPDTIPQDYGELIAMATARVGLPKVQLAQLLHIESQTLYNAGVSRPLAASSLARLYRILSIRGWRQLSLYVQRLRAARTGPRTAEW